MIISMDDSDAGSLEQMRAFLAGIILLLPWMVMKMMAYTSGILGDLPHVVSLASGVLQQTGVSDRCKVVGCDFLEAVPSGGDAYILKHIIHDWDDERARAILRNCHRVMGASARLLIIDMVLPEQPTPEGAIGYLVDMTMLAVTPGGRETNTRRISEIA